MIFSSVLVFFGFPCFGLEAPLRAVGGLERHTLRRTYSRSAWSLRRCVLHLEYQPRVAASPTIAESAPFDHRGPAGVRDTAAKQTGFTRRMYF